MIETLTGFGFEPSRDGPEAKPPCPEFMGEHDGPLFGRFGKKASIVPNAKAERTPASEIPGALALVPLHVRNPLGNPRALRLPHGCQNAENQSSYSPADDRTAHVEKHKIDTLSLEAVERAECVGCAAEHSVQPGCNDGVTLSEVFEKASALRATGKRNGSADASVNVARAKRRSAHHGPSFEASLLDRQALPLVSLNGGAHTGVPEQPSWGGCHVSVPARM